MSRMSGLEHGHPHPVPGHDLDQPILLQAHERLANRRAGHAKILRQRLLGHFRAGRQLAVEQLGFQGGIRGLG